MDAAFDPADEMVAPDGLGDAGRRLWDSIAGGLPPDWRLDERECELLGLAARQADTLAALEALVEAEGLTTTGSTGQVVLHPAVAEARQARLSIDRLLGKIVMPAPEKSGETGSSAHARTAAGVLHDLQARREARGA